ncbi:MAG: hypothetical protein J6R22_05500 [Alphaproteobacteria bacterium]|nr:hypothetical protein [Alphaproteobacteria bacterium]
MRKFLTCFWVMCLVAPAAFASTGGISRAITTSSDEVSSVRNRTTILRTPSRTVGSTAADKNGVRTTASVTRSVKTADEASARDNLSSAVNTVGRNSRVSAASINNNPALRRAGVVLRPSTAEVGGRATISGTGKQTGSNVDEEIRSVRARAATETSRESITDAKERLEQTAELNKTCQQQYNECMDQFCAVVDANQKRCSCSANITRYKKIEDAVKEANTQLNDVAQRIRYVGLSADEIRAIMNETEAETELNGSRDTSETRNMLEEIEEMIRNPSSAASYSADTYSGLDFDLDFSSEASDIFNLDFLNTDNTSSFSNLRGSSLYNAAKKRCNTILNSCKDAGATPQQITGNYDLAIDKDCLAYEQGLVKMNDALKSNVRSAGLMLQKARLAVLENKNQYDARGCVAALETCMSDDMVCGSDYYKCLDPTKKYIDENGQVILGQDITQITKLMSDYDNSTINSEFLSDSSSAVCSSGAEGEAAANGSCNVKYLLQKIGTGDKVTDGGLCRAVLDKCQRYTYKDDKYQKYNDIVTTYVQRAMVNVKAAQHKIIADYASDCISDIASCYNQQYAQINSWTSAASVSNISSVMRGACRNVALTCAYAVFDSDTASVCGAENGTCTDAAYIDAISEMFYQSLLCPEYSTYDKTGAGSSNVIGNNKQWVNKLCKCNTGYKAWGSSCKPECSGGAEFKTDGGCPEPESPEQSEPGGDEGEQETEE